MMSEEKWTSRSAWGYIPGIPPACGALINNRYSVHRGVSFVPRYRLFGHMVFMDGWLRYGLVPGLQLK